MFPEMTWMWFRSVVASGAEHEPPWQLAVHVAAVLAGDDEAVA